MFEIILSLSVINAFLIIVLIPLFGIKERLNFWKQPLSHFEDRKDTRIIFKIIFSIFIVNQFLIGWLLSKTNDLGSLTIFLLAIAAFTCLVPTLLSWIEHPFVHTVCAWISGLTFLVYSLSVDYQIFKFANQTLGYICFVVTFSMLLSLIYFAHRRRHTKIHPINTIGEYLLLIPIIVWNFILIKLL